MAEPSSICVGCGLCCDGTLFSHLGALDENDLGLPLRMLRVELIVQADPPAFALPCPAFDGEACSIYHLHRPMACRTFECDLLVACREGTVGEHDARRIIEHTRQVRDRVRAGEVGEEQLRDLVRAHFRHDADG